MATYADSNSTALSYIVETTWGEIPASPTFTYTRYTGETLAFNISNETSKEIRNDSNVTDLIQIGAESAGGWTFEVSYESPSDDLIEAAIRSTDFPSDISGVITGLTDIVVSASGKTYTTTAGDFSDVSVGDWIRVSGFSTNLANNGYKLVTGVTTGASDVITVAQTCVDDSTGDTIAMYGSTIRNNTVTAGSERSFTIMRQHDDVDQYFVWKGMFINTYTMEVAANQIITGSFDFMGGLPDLASTTFSTTAAPNAAPSNDVYSAVSDVATIYFDTTESTLQFMNLSFSATNNLRGKPAIGTLGNIQIGKGIFDVTGTFSTYFEDEVLYNKFIDGTEFQLHFGVHSNVDTPTSSESYIFSFPRCKVESDTGPQASSQNQDLMEDISFRALYSATAGCTMSISKIKANA